MARRVYINRMPEKLQKLCAFFTLFSTNRSALFFSLASVDNILNAAINKMSIFKIVALCTLHKKNSFMHHEDYQIILHARDTFSLYLAELQQNNDFLLWFFFVIFFFFLFSLW